MAIQGFNNFSQEFQTHKEWACPKFLSFPAKCGLLTWLVNDKQGVACLAEPRFFDDAKLNSCCVKTRLALKELQLHVGYVTLMWWWMAFYFVLPDPYCCKYCHKRACLISCHLLCLVCGGVLVLSTSDYESVLFWFWMLFTEGDLSWKCSIKISHLLMWVSTIPRWPGCWGGKHVWYGGGAAVREGSQCSFWGSSSRRRPRPHSAALGRPWAPALGSTASMALAAEFQSRARVSQAVPVPHHCWSAQSTPQPCHAECAQELHRQQLVFQMHSMAGYVTGSFRIPLIGNIKSKSVC